jgi:hypothetical protein
MDKEEQEREQLASGPPRTPRWNKKKSEKTIIGSSSTWRDAEIAFRLQVVVTSMSRL